MKSKIDKYSQILESLNNIHSSNESICTFLVEHKRHHSEAVSNLQTHIEKISDSVKDKIADKNERA
jgi:hypothetical protein